MHGDKTYFNDCKYLCQWEGDVITGHLLVSRQLLLQESSSSDNVRTIRIELGHPTVLNILIVNICANEKVTLLLVTLWSLDNYYCRSPTVLNILLIYCWHLSNLGHMFFIKNEIKSWRNKTILLTLLETFTIFSYVTRSNSFAKKTT